MMGVVWQAGVLTRFFGHMQTVQPTVMATFNGDFFDMPFLDARSKAHGIDMFQEIGCVLLPLHPPQPSSLRVFAYMPTPATHHHGASV